MIDRLMKAVQSAGDVVVEQVNTLGNSAKEKGYELIEEWLNAIPLLEACGLKVTGFALGVSISPMMELEFSGKHSDFSSETIDEILLKHKGNTVVQAIFNIIKTAYRLNLKVNAPLDDPLIVKAKVRISPEIKVLIGQRFVQE